MPVHGGNKGGMKMSIQFGDIENIEMNPSQLSRALDIPIFEIERFLLDVKEKKTNELPNVVGFFRWLKNIIRDKSSNDIIVYMDKRDIPWTLFARLLAEDDLEDYLEQSEINVIAEAFATKANSI